MKTNQRATCINNCLAQISIEMLTAIAEHTEYKNSGTAGHTERTRRYMKLLSLKMIENKIYTDANNIENPELTAQAARLHDIGKIGIPDSILSKTGKLTKEEFEVIKNHTMSGKETIDQIRKKVGESELLKQAALMAYTHHERWDGKGYPQMLKGEEIPLYGRMMALADVYDALVSPRPYKPAYTHEKAMIIIAEGIGTQFDPILADLFINIEKEILLISNKEQNHDTI